jgi:hypothetical protein
LVDCSACSAIGHWRGMAAEKIFTHRQESKLDAEDSWWWKRTCIACVAKAENLTIEDATLKVLSKPIAHKKARAEQLETAKELVREKIEVLNAEGGSRKMKKELLKSTLEELFSPLAAYILRKQAALELVRQDTQRHDALTERLSKCPDWQSEAAVIAELEALEVDNRYEAFKGEDQAAYLMAASYSDMWTQVRGAGGELVGGISSWYVCLAQTGYTATGGGGWSTCACLRVTPSKDWGTKHANPMATGQAWYCKCNARYRAGWGQLVEIVRLNRRSGQLEYSYVKADVPSWDIEDVRAMHLEDTMKVSSAADLYAQIRRVEPTLTSIIIRDSEQCTKVVDAATWQSIPTFRWVEVFNLAGVMAPAVVAKKGK